MRILMFPFTLFSRFLTYLDNLFFPKVTLRHVLQTSLEDARLKLEEHRAAAERAAADVRNHRAMADMLAKRAERLEVEIEAERTKYFPPAPDRREGIGALVSAIRQANPSMDLNEAQARAKQLHGFLFNGSSIVVSDGSAINLRDVFALDKQPEHQRPAGDTDTVMG